ncbi:hypothetical protein EV702DRAFT_1178670 [Suillus placidus]|uniref:Uncharacterized protein n=1 Tax=Suillus placidus TaxID=48579 RepID=A0A9P6ZZB2_9AGAM|nr:hypothetical protein EV702DRAFT_1178670 [Suillus placidus]
MEKKLRDEAVASAIRAKVASDPPLNKKPWRPFKSRLEYEVAQIALEAALNNEQTDRLIKLCCRCAIGKEKFTFENHKDIHKKWDAASERFTKEVISMTFEDKIWDFEHLSKFDGENFVRFIDEPYTADAFWDFQSQLPERAKPLAFILYANKTKLSSSGAAKAYPVVARLANLPTDICNGEGLGGGYVVGWLPVKEDKEFAKKLGWANFKNKVWHKAFLRILSSLSSKSKTGQWFECLDRLSRWFFPSILILSADYEEQCVMALVRGVRSLWPCPICLVPRDALSDASKRHPLRTSSDSQAIIKLARMKRTLEEREKMLKEYGLRDVDNSLWSMTHTDLHFHDCGLFDDHLWVELQKYLNSLGRDTVSQIDKRFKAFPHWRNQKHPNQVMDIAFTDSSIPEIILKMILYAAHDVVTEENCLLGYLLLRCIRLYIEVDMYASLDVHTSNTIREGRNAVEIFSVFLRGATRNYNMKPNKKMHGSLKDSYLLRTNFRNVADQILRVNHWQLVAEDIHRHLSDFDEYHCSHAQDLNQSDDNILNDFLPACNIPLPQGKQVCLQATDEITEFRFLKVNYESMVDWRQHTDYLCCSPHFFGAPYFDCVFIQMATKKVIFGRLIFLFECIVGKHTFLLALVHPFDAPTGACLRKDKNLNFFRAQFFSVRSIICGALLVPDGPFDHLVVDTVDSDMFLRMREMHLEAGHLVRA